MPAIQNPLLNWRVDRATLRTIGHDLQRPECILAERDGTLWAADARGGAMRIAPDGTQQLITPKVLQVGAPQSSGNAAVSFDNRYIQAQGSLPNGMACKVCLVLLVFLP